MEKMKFDYQPTCSAPGCCEPAAYKILVSAPCPVLSLRVNAPVPEKVEHKGEEVPAIFG